MTTDDLLLSDSDERDRRIALLEELLQRERARADQAERSLREIAGSEGDGTLGHQLAIWRTRAERDGYRMALAERVVRQVIAGKSPVAAIAAWRKESTE